MSWDIEWLLRNTQNGKSSCVYGRDMSSSTVVNGQLDAVMQNILEIFSMRYNNIIEAYIDIFTTADSANAWSGGRS